MKTVNVTGHHITRAKHMSTENNLGAFLSLFCALVAERKKFDILTNEYTSAH